MARTRSPRVGGTPAPDVAPADTGLHALARGEVACASAVRAERRARHGSVVAPPLGFARLSVNEAAAPEELVAPFYLRFVVRDRPGILAELARILAGTGKNGDAGCPGATGGQGAPPWDTGRERGEGRRAVDGAAHSVLGEFVERQPDGRRRLLGRGAGCINTGGEKV